MSGHETPSVDEQLSEELGVDVVAMEAALRFRLEHARLKRGENSQLGYILSPRTAEQPFAVVFATAEDAQAALAANAEGRLAGCTAPESITLSDLASREIILP